VSWVEEMVAKHSRLPTNVLVLAARRPFSKEACRVADLYRVRRLVLTDLEPTAPGRLFPTANSLWGKAWQLEIDRVEVHVQEGSLAPEWFKASSDIGVYLEGDPDTSSPLGEVVMMLLKRPEVTAKVGSEGLPEHAFLEVGWQSPAIEGRALTVRKEPIDVYRRIALLRVITRVRITVDEFPLRHAMVDAIKVAWGTGRLLNAPALLVVTSKGTESPRVTLQVRTEDDSRKES
jgi:hypothetical protein